MRVAHFYPNDFMGLFSAELERKGHAVMRNRCDGSADFVYCGSVSLLDKAMAEAGKWRKRIVCWVWDIPFDWRLWCRNNRERREHGYRDGVVAGRLKKLKECDLVISASRFTQRELKRHGIDSKQMYFYIDTDGIDSFETKTDARYDRVVQISRFVLNKRFDMTIEAARKLSDAHFDLVGTGTKNMKRLIECSPPDGVKFYCNIPRAQTIDILKHATVLVSPSVFEGWGITPIEAVHCGVPVLLSDIPVFRETWGDSAIYHKRDDPDDMADKLKRLLGDKELRSGVVREGRKRITEFTVRKFADRWIGMVEGSLG